MRYPKTRLRGLIVVLLAVACFPAWAASRTTVEPPAQVAVSPSRFELEIGSKPTTESLTLFNYSDDPMKIQVSVANWDLDDANQIRILEPNEQSLDQWLVINPLQFTVPGKKSQTVRFSIRPRIQPEPGEHRAMIYFDQQLDPEAASTKVRIKFRLGVAIYGYAGGSHREGNLNSVRVISGADPVLAKFDIASTGSSHVRMIGRYAIWPADDYPGFENTPNTMDSNEPDQPIPEVVASGALPSRPVLPGTRREVMLQTTASLPPGAYVLDVNGRMSEQPIDLGIPFNIPYRAQVSGPAPE